MAYWTNVGDRPAVVLAEAGVEGANRSIGSRVAVSGTSSIIGVDGPACTVPAAALTCGLVLAYAAIAAGTGTAPELRLGVLLGAALAATLIALSVIDLRTFRLPDRLTLPLAAAGVVAAWLLGEDPVWRIASAVAGHLALRTLIAAYRWWRGADGMGLGDAKLLAAAGAWLGMEGLPTTVLMACLSGLLLAGVRALVSRSAARRRLWSERVPFGPHLALGIWIVWLYGPL